MQMDDNDEIDDADGEFDDDDDDATPRPHKHANAHKTQIVEIDEAPFRTPLVLDSKYCAVDRAIDTKSDRSDLENLGNAHKGERQGVSYTWCLLLWRLTIQ